MKTLTQKAQELGISQGYLSNILCGRRRPNPDLALKISKITKTPLEIWLFKTPETLKYRNVAIKQALNNNTAFDEV